MTTLTADLHTPIIELDAFQFLATAANNEQRGVQGAVQVTLSVPEGVNPDTEALEGYFEDSTIDYFMARFFEAMLLNQGMSGVIKYDGERIITTVGVWNCPVEFVFTEEERDTQESYWTQQKVLGNQESDRIIFYVNKEFIRTIILPLLEHISEGFNSKKDDIGVFTRLAISKLMLMKVFNGKSVGMHGSQDPTSSSYKILAKYKSNSTANKKKSKGK